MRNPGEQNMSEAAARTGNLAIKQKMQDKILEGKREALKTMDNTRKQINI